MPDSGLYLGLTPMLVRGDWRGASGGPGLWSRRVSRGQLEVVSPSFGEIQLLNSLFVVSHQGEIFGAGLMKSNGIARKSTRLSHQIPDIRVVRAALE